ncbi:ABC transporter ATP-binding protein [Actinoplanes sp. NPDC048791]|uniref:ABC transporter ATP-binding protein n=1 Tax=Actinoplanes sp. NPDC048791 TaxID=3154623 RepID=UPI0033D7CE64
MSAAVSAAWHLLRMAWSIDRRRLTEAAGLVLAGQLATPLLAVALRGFVNAALNGLLGRALTAAAAMSVLLVIELSFSHFAHLRYFELGEQCEVALYEELLLVTNGVAGIEHLDDPTTADTTALVREDLVRTRIALEAVLQISAMTAQIAVAAVLLAAVQPWLMLLPLAAAPAALISSRAQRLIEAAKERSAASTRRSAHLVELATRGDAIKEIRLFGAEEPVLDLQRQAWEQATVLRWSGVWRAAALRSAGQSLFVLANAAALILVVTHAARGRVTVGDVVLVVALAVPMSVQVSSALGLLSTLHGAARTFERITQLGTRATASHHPPVVPTAPVPAELRRGIEFDHVSFSYAGTTRPVLDDVCVTVPAGTSLAVVGDNGAGKSTLVKLLCGLYRPTSGRILIDGVDLATMAPSDWYAKVAPLFQDHMMLELTLRENVGIGHVSKIDDDEALTAALGRGGAERMLRQLPGGLDSLLGQSYGPGAQLSGGQWQSLSLARAAIRQAPLVLLLDEPAAALDAIAEQDLFDRFAASAPGSVQRGAITIFVSHRLSTVRMADQVLVLDGGSVAEQGTHNDLVNSGGLYAALFALQAEAYASPE